VFSRNRVVDEVRKAVEMGYIVKEVFEFLGI